MTHELDQYLAALRRFLDAQSAMRAARAELNRYLEESGRIGKTVHFMGLEHAEGGAAHGSDTVVFDAECWPTAALLQSLTDAQIDAERHARRAYTRMVPAERELVHFPFSSLSHH